MKLPIVITYVSDRRGGKELRYALRSFKNIKNWNGELFIIGDKEGWFTSELTYIRAGRQGNSWLDQAKKVAIMCANIDLPDNFILTHDDIYITKPMVVKNYYQGELPSESKSIHGRSKVLTRDFLEGMGLPTVDYECHTPIILNKKKYMETYSLMVNIKTPLQFRSIYGNQHKLKAELFEDKKTKTHELKEGKIISTQFYTDELDKMFPNASRFEKHML